MFTVSYISLGTAKTRNGAEKFRSLVTWSWIQFPFHLKFRYILFPLQCILSILEFLYFILEFLSSFLYCSASYAYFNWYAYISLFSFHFQRRVATAQRMEEPRYFLRAVGGEENSHRLLFFFVSCDEIATKFIFSCLLSLLFLYITHRLQLRSNY